jgi:DNA-binding LacI/PurR family transcriptional regulator
MSSRLSDIAALASVSEATVSRVLNGRPGVAEATRKTVLAAVDMLGYDRPSRLRRTSAGLVGLITPELTNPIFPGIAQLIEKALFSEGYTPVLCTQTDGHVHEDDYVRMLIDRGVAGIIFVCGIHTNTDADPARYNALRKRGLPIVLMNGFVSGVDAPFISNDDVASVEVAFDHLVHQGHERIGLAVGPPRYVTVQRKAASFRAASAAAFGRHDVDELISHASFTVDGGAAAATDLIARGVTGIIAASDLMALGAIRGARARGLEVPHDLSVIGYDDSPLMEFTNPALTTVRQNIAAMSQAATRLLLAEIKGDLAPRAEMIFAPELVVRASTGLAPSRKKPEKVLGRRRPGGDEANRSITRSANQAEDAAPEAERTG